MKIKQVIVVRTKYQHADGTQFSLRTGKLIAQGCHASISFLSHKIRNSLNGQKAEINLTEAELAWIEGAFTKICLKVNTEEELKEIHQKALDLGLVSHIIIDNGATEFNGIPTATCLAIGPDYADKIDLVTKDLTLY